MTSQLKKAVNIDKGLSHFAPFFRYRRIMIEKTITDNPPIMCANKTKSLMLHS